MNKNKTKREKLHEIEFKIKLLENSRADYDWVNFGEKKKTDDNFIGLFACQKMFRRNQYAFKPLFLK